MNTTNVTLDYRELLPESDDNFEFCNCSEISESLEKIYRHIQAYKAGFSDREYVFEV